ncbi:hypothetical protein RHSP_41378 (plasmid) [Rhizobium freirei PRF 81]|uniref:Uncharacterized protein n=1 Tax=Rhizobium freirei PRF 81 TaxID=363754 RepID=N6U0A1_9HYPH|nr:hypothetical protein [Rhizobium freirei]ENN83833.1 hypothetical protein RHSP_41378 [Rhizobium freirei PRF 81]
MFANSSSPGILAAEIADVTSVEYSGYRSGSTAQSTPGTEPAQLATTAEATDVRLRRTTIEQRAAECRQTQAILSPKFVYAGGAL